MSRALIIVRLAATFIVGVILLIGAFYVYEFSLRIMAETDWQKAIRIRAMLDSWRWWGIPIPPIRMTFETMDLMDSLTVFFIAMRSAMPAFLVWRTLVGAAQRLDALDHAGFRNAPFTAIFDEYRIWWRDTGMVWSLRYKYAKHLVQRTRQYLRGAGIAALIAATAALYVGVSLVSALIVGVISYAVLLFALPWVLRHVFGDRLAPFPSLANRYQVEQVFDPPVSEALPFATAMTGGKDNTIGVFNRFANGQHKHRAAIETAYRNSLQLAHPAEKEFPQPIDVGALSPEGRLLYLPIVINADNAKGIYDRLDFKLSDHARHHYVYRAERRGIDVARWRDALTTIETYLGGRWHITPKDGATLTMTKLPEIQPSFTLPSDALRPGSAFFGIDLNTGEQIHVALDKLSHTLIAGPTGMGKSVLLHQLMASIVTNLDRFEAVHLVDLKYGLELQDYPALSNKFHLTSAGAEMPALLDTLLAEMDRRGALMRENKSTNWRGPLIMIVIDEFADMLLAPDKKAERDLIVTKLTRLTNLSRALGFRFWVQSQKFTADAIPTPIRNNLQSLISFRMVSNQQAAMLFGGIEDFPADVRDLRPGQMIYRDGLTSQMYALQGAMVAIEDVIHVHERTRRD